MGGLARVSVIVPVYNMALYLPQCLDSLLAQEGVALEVLVVDDGSTDDIVGVMGPYRGSVDYVRIEHWGLCAALNTGVQHVTGEYLVFLAADDLRLPGSLAEEARALDDHPTVGLVMGQAIVVDEEGRSVGLRAPRLRGGLVPSDRAFRWLLRGCRVPAPTVMVRRRAVDEVGPFREPSYPGEDWDMWLRIASRYDLYYLPRPLAYYRVHPGSVTARYTVEDVEASHLYTLAALFGEGQSDRSLEGTAYAYLDRVLAALAARLGQRRDFLRYFWRAVGQRPALLLEGETWGCVAVGLRSLAPGPLTEAARRLKRLQRRPPRSPQAGKGLRAAGGGT